MLVLEARDRVGGRVLSHTLGGGDYAELGGMFTGPTQDHIQALASDVGVGIYPTYNTGNNVFSGERPARRSSRATRRSARRRRTPWWRRTSCSPWPSSTRWPRGARERPWDAPERGGVGPPDARHLAARAHERQRRVHGGSPAATEAIFGGEPRDLSLLYTVFYIAASGDEQNQGTFERNFNTAGGAQEQRFAGGAHNVPQRLAARSAAAIVLHAPVRADRRRARSGVTVMSDRLTVQRASA